MLATASNDGTVKVWIVPEDGGMHADLQDSEAYASLADHTKAVNFCKWNPNASFVLASASRDQSLKIWDIREQQGVANYRINSGVSSLEWNHDGQILGCI